MAAINLGKQLTVTPMAFVQPLHRSFICSSEKFVNSRRKPSQSLQRIVVMKTVTRHTELAIQASSGVNAETSNMDGTEDKSEEYSSTMSNAMGAVLTYKHELGMNYNFVLPDLIVGSCLQSPEDVDKLMDIGVVTVFCLQKDSDLDYFGVDITAIQERAKEYDGIQHIRAEIRDFDPFDLRMRLPSVVAKLYRVIRNDRGITYVHCTAGLGRAPAVTLAYMYWILGYKLSEANKLLQSARKCCPNLEAIKRATADMLTGGYKQEVTLKWRKEPCTNVEVAGLDIGWDQRLSMTYDEMQGCWVLHRDLPVGGYEYKYVVDGNWLCNADELVTHPNADGHMNNYIEVKDDHLDPITKKTIQRLMQEEADLTETEQNILREKLEALSIAE